MTELFSLLYTHFDFEVEIWDAGFVLGTLMLPSTLRGGGGLFQVEKKVNIYLWSPNPSLSTFNKPTATRQVFLSHLQHGETKAKEGYMTFPRPSPVNWTQLMGCQRFITGTFSHTFVVKQGCLMNETSTSSVSSIDLISKCSKSNTAIVSAHWPLSFFQIFWNCSWANWYVSILSAEILWKISLSPSVHTFTTISRLF